MSTVSDALSILDNARATLADVGLCPYRAFVRVTTWSEGRIGQGASTTITTELVVARNRPPKVELVTDKDVVAGGLMSEARYKIGPLTPSYAGGGTTIDTLDPPTSEAPAETHYILLGPGLPAEGMLCKKVGDAYDSPFRYTVTVEALGKPAGL